MVHVPSQRKVTDGNYHFLGGGAGGSPTSHMNNLNHVLCMYLYLP